MAKAKSRATYDDLLKLPEHVVGEIIDGELIVSPRPAPRHADAEGAITTDLRNRFHGPPGGAGGPGGWWILPEPELHFREDVLVPDLAGWRRARMPKLPLTAAFELAPDWVCEILSPRTGAVDRARKMPIYARHGVAFAWLVDPVLRTLEIFHLDGGSWVVVGAFTGAEVVKAPPFDAVDLEIARWWSEE